MPFQRRMRALPLSRIQLTDPFWSRWQKVLVERTLPAIYDQLESTGRLANFRKAAGDEPGVQEGRYFNDSDVYKWIEAAAYGLAVHPDAKLRALLDKTVETVAKTQRPDGYINTFFQTKHPGKEFKNLSSLHEMYCCGHLIEAAVAMHESLGDDKLLGVGVRFADHIMSIFGPDKREGYPGHEELEWALIRLTNATGQPKYREFAYWLIEERGKRPSPLEAELRDPESVSLAPWGPGFLMKNGVYQGDYYQDHAPIRKHTQVVGHAVRAMYLYIAVADMAAETGDVDLEKALERAWNNLTHRRMYVTGGIGPSPSNEGFTTDFDLPNLTAYAETCAAVGLSFWGQRMLEASGNSEYADVVERALYNGALSGISLDGELFFYENPLESRGGQTRVPWFDCACCPPNIARLIGDLGAYVASEAESDFYIHQFVGFTAKTVLGGVQTTITVTSNFPWTGALQIRIDPATPVEFALHLRIPEWSDDVSTEIPGATNEAEYENGYAVFRRTWSKGDTMTVDLGMESKWVESDPRVRDNLGRSALTRGPLVYCAEAHDAGFAPQLFTVDLDVPPAEQFEEILEGVVTLTAEGVHDLEEFDDSLYAPQGTSGAEEWTMKFIPYYAWCNRGATDMQVWVRSA